MSRNRTIIVTIGLMLGIFMASMEATVIATAMPTIVGELGGIELYSWAFSIYMLASTATVPVFGKLSDLYGRRPIFLASMGLFLFGSLLCGIAPSMALLVAARGVQGLGAGGLLPLALTMIGDMFSFEQRTRMQGVFSGVWGVSSVIGPLIGGFLVDQVAWQWVFFINLPPGLLTAALVGLAWQDRPRPADAPRPSIDYAGAALLSAGVITLLMGLTDLRSPANWALLTVALACLTGLWHVERRAANPMLPVYLLNDRMFAVACAQGVLIGWGLFGSTTYVPLFVQGVLGAPATQAGAALTPMLLLWVTASIIGTRLLLRVSYRTLALVGVSLVVLGMGGLALLSRVGNLPLLYVTLGVIGMGMGLTIPAFLIAVQSTVQRQDLGTATSTLQFARNIGGTLGVSVMGTLLAALLASRLVAAGLDPASVDANALLSRGEGTAVMVPAAAQAALGGAIQGVFLLGFAIAVLCLAVTWLAPRVSADELAGRRSEPEPAKSEPAPAALPAD